MIKKVKAIIDGEEKEIYVPIEEHYNLYINNKLILEDHAISPENLKEFAAGFSIDGGYLKSIEKIDIEENSIFVYGEEGKIKRAKEKAKIDFELIKYIGSKKLDYKYWELTGGFHWASIFNGKDLICFFEDISRHNAVDKVIGYCILNNINLDNTILRYSGRIPKEIVDKAANSNIKVIISKATATDKAIERAKEENIRLIKVRNNKLIVYW